MRKIIISRTDNIGDVMLTLPLAGFLKSYFGGKISLIFIGKGYTKALIEASEHIDKFLDREKVIKDPSILKATGADTILHIYPDKPIAKAAFKANIKTRIGTSHRLFHWLYCNKRVTFSRKKSDLHESQLNFKLLKPLGISTIALSRIPEYYGFNKIKTLPENLERLIQPEKTNLIFHPKSKGSAREWPLENYFTLAKNLHSSSYRIFITGTETEGNVIRAQHSGIFSLPNVMDLTGKLTLEQLISFIKECDGLVACSTGPLHIAAALGKNVCGIYPPMKPIHPGRWAPLGKRASVIVLPQPCNKCKITQKCFCIEAIEAQQVTSLIETWGK